MDKATRATPKEDEESEAVIAWLDRYLQQIGLSDDAYAREQFRSLMDTKYIEQSIDELKVAEELMKYHNPNSRRKKDARKK